MDVGRWSPVEQAAGPALTDPTTAGQLVQEVARDVAEASRAVSDVARAVPAGSRSPRPCSMRRSRCRSVVLARHSLRGSRRCGADPARARRGAAAAITGRVERRRGHPSGVRPDPGRPGPRRGPHPAPAAAGGHSRRSMCAPVARSGWVSSALVAPGMSMIGAPAGAWPRRGPGLPQQPVPAGSDLVLPRADRGPDGVPGRRGAAGRASRRCTSPVRFPKVVRRSIHHPFGAGFCKACLVDPEETDELPAHQIPEELTPEHRRTPTGT